jgi:hypothetical protein
VIVFLPLCSDIAVQIFELELDSHIGFKREANRYGMVLVSNHAYHQIGLF